MSMCGGSRSSRQDGRRDVQKGRPRRALAACGVALAALAALPACSTLSGLVDETEPVVVVPQSPADGPDGRADWVTYAPDALPSTDWIAEFDDPALTRLVAEATRENPSLRRAVAQFDSSLANARITRAGLYPQLGGSGRVDRLEGGTDFLAGQTQYNLGLSASWEVDLFGRIRDGFDADIAGAQASAADLAGVRLSVATQVAQTWFDAIEADLLVRLSRRDIETQERILRLTTRRFESGLTGGSDVRLARSSLANSQALREQRIQVRNATLRQLQALLRDYPDADVNLPEDLPGLPLLEGAAGPVWALTHRPDMIAAEYRIAEAGLDVDAARKLLLPTLTLNAGASEQALNLGDALDLANIAYQIGEQLTAPIFQAGRIRAQIDATRAQLDARIETYVETAITAFTEVENALDAEVRLSAREAALRVSLDEAEAAEERLQLRYAEGLATILQLLDAQTRVLNAESQLINARAERLASRVRLHAALGGGELGAISPVTVAPLDLPLVGPVGNGGTELIGPGPVRVGAPVSGDPADAAVATPIASTPSSSGSAG